MTKKLSPKNQALADMKAAGVSSYVLRHQKEVLTQPKLTDRVGRLG